MRLQTRVGKTAMRFILLGIAFLLLANILARFNIVDLTAWNNDIITVVIAFALLFEVSFFGKISNRGKLGIYGWIVGIVALAALLGVIGSAFGFVVPFLSTYQGLIDTTLLVLAVVEIFR